MDNIQEKILNILKKYRHEKADRILLVAFSGGIDSLCLMDNLFKLSDNFKFKIIAAHLNHNWRGAESKDEEERAEEYCLERGIEFYTEILPDTLPKTELEARNRRYEFLNRAAGIFNADIILTGHTLSDQAETLLYRIIKGTGIHGLKGIPEIRYQEEGVPILRPMLTITREETLRYCEENNLNPNVDTSNYKEEYLRNKIRLKLLPELKHYNENIENSLYNLSLIASDEENIVEDYISTIKKEIYIDNKRINTKSFLKLADPTKRRIVYDLLKIQGIEFDFKKISEILDFIQENSILKSGNTLSLSKNLWLFVSNNYTELINAIRAHEIKSFAVIDKEGEYSFPELNLTLKITKWDCQKMVKPEKFPEESSYKILADLSSIDFPLFLRTRRAGDVISPFGMNISTKLKKYLINKGIPEYERDKIHILATNSEILWVAGIGISESLRVKNLPTHIIELI